MSDENFNRLKRPSKIHIKHFLYFQNSGVQGCNFDGADELVDSDDEKPCQGKTKEWIKRRRESGYFQKVFQELKFEDRMGFKVMFHMSVTDFEFLLSQISDFISPTERVTGIWRLFPYSHRPFFLL